MSPEAKTGHCNGPASSSLGEAIALAGEAIAPAGVEEDDEVPKEAAVMAQMKPGTVHAVSRDISAVAKSPETQGVSHHV